MKSTIVRSIQSFTPLLSRWAPGTAAWALEQLFLTPSRPRAPERERQWLASADADRTTLPDGRTLPCWSWGEGPTVLLVHGWSGRGSQLAAMARPLVHAGYRVVTFDHPGHGTSSGTQCGIPDMALAIRHMVARAGTVTGIVAHSLGTAGVMVALRQGLEVDALVFVSPPANPPAYLAYAGRHLGFSPSIVPRTRERLEARFGMPFDTFSTVKEASRQQRPLLLVHDEDDTVAPVEDGQAIAAAWTGSTTLWTHGLGHRRILRDAHVIDAVIRHLGAHREARRAS